MNSPVLAADYWGTNAELITQCVRLRYLRKDWMVLDPTYGNGLWWTKFRPHNLIFHDIKIDGVDFTDLPYEDDQFDAVTYDPPYVSKGGRKTKNASMQKHQKAYGLGDAPRTPALLQELIDAGLEECSRVLMPVRRSAPGGYLLVRCQDYISGGKFWPGTYYTHRKAESLGLEQVDRFEFLVKKPRPQPKRTRLDPKTGRRVASKQQHARRNISTLLVYRKLL